MNNELFARKKKCESKCTEMMFPSASWLAIRLTNSKTIVTVYRLIHSFHVKSELAKPSCELCSVIDLLMEWTKFAYISPGTDVDGYHCMCMYFGINLNPIIRLPLRIVTNILFLLMRSAGKLNPWEWKMNSRNVCLTLRLWHWKCLYKIFTQIFFCACVC